MDSRRIVSPPPSEFRKLRQPLETGELALFDALNRQLPEVWEIYLQPHMNGLCPDFVLLNPQVGVVVIEVKDWDFKLMRYEWETVPRKRIKRLVATKNGKKFFVENPLAKANLYGSEILDLYCPSVGISLNNTPVVSSVVYFSKLSTQEAINFAKAGFQDGAVDGGVIQKYYPAIGYDVLSVGIFDSIPFLKMKSSKYMKEEFAGDLRYWLEESRAKKDQRTQVSLSVEQKSLISREKTVNGYRRIRGAAGSGKSLVLASKAANLALQGSRVLIVTYNITLCNYISDLVVRAALPNKGIRKKVDYLNYHMWAKRVCILAGQDHEYDALSWEENLALVLKKDLPDLVNSILEENVPEDFKYDAILVDEGQDFQLLWWQTLTRIVRESGEAILVADKTQDLYESASAWTDEAMNSAGFRGPWNELKVSYRLPVDYITYIRDFLRKYISDEFKIEPEPLQSSLSILKTHMRWIQTTSLDQNIEACVSAVLSFPLRKRLNDNVVYTDIVVLAETNDSGFQIVRKLGNKGVKVRHTFGISNNNDEYKDIRKQKVAFFLGAEQVKATTIHSYKGWESTCIVVEILSGNSKSAIASAYTALTRLKASERGEDSYITVICNAPEFEEYGKTWPEFSRI